MQKELFIRIMIDWGGLASAPLLKLKNMKTIEEILQETNLPELFWQHDMQNEVIRAMEEYAQQYRNVGFVKKEDLETIVREVVEKIWYDRRSINPVEEQTEEITNGIYNKLMGINVEKQTCKCDNRHVGYSLKTDKPHCINCHKDIAE